MEMKTFCMEFFEGVKEETFLEQSAGVADVITSCKLQSACSGGLCREQSLQAGLGGRNMKVAAAFVKEKRVSGSTDSSGGRAIADICKVV
jgi:glycerol-3-phosphate dehydrogenase (NAD+)